MADYIKFKDKHNKEDDILPLADMLSKKVFYRDYESGDLQLDVNALIHYNPQFYEDLINRTGWFMDICRKSISEVFDLFPEEKDSQGNVIEVSCLPKNILNFKLINIPESINIQISSLRSENMGKLIRVKGMLKRIVQTTSKINSVVFECPENGEIIEVEQNQNSIVYPKKCQCGFRGKFIKGAEKFINVQEMEVEECVDDIGSRQPQKIKLFLQGSLTEDSQKKYQVGNKVEVLATLSKLPNFLSGKDIDRTLLEYVLYVVQLENLDASDLNVKITDEDEKQIKEISNKNPLDYLAENLAPNIFGMHQIKKALVLFLAKGVTKIPQDGDRKRGEIHVLLVGDPGIAKSSLLQNIQKRVYNCRLADGKETSRAGLVAALSKDKATEKWVVEAGDLVLANKGYLLLDEADKLSQDDIKAIHRPLEQGEAVLSKAGIHATFKTETSLLAVANPKIGSFDPIKPIISQIDFSSTLLSRFDLIFVLKDIINQEEDELKAKHILDVHMGKVNKKLDTDFIKKYFGYITKLKPILSEEVAVYFTKQYSKLRQMSENSGVRGSPLTPRNVEGLIRLAEAHAKIRLSEKVEMCDAKVAEDLFLYSLQQFGYDPDEKIIDLSRITVKISPSKRDKYYLVLQTIQDMNKDGSELSRQKIVERCQRKLNLNYGECLDIIDLLHQSAEIYEPQPNIFALSEKNIN